MEDLKTLISLLSVQKIKQIEILTEDAQMSPKTMALYNGVLNGQINSDEEAAAFLYQSDEKDPAYRKLKYRLTQRLINTLFFIDVQEYSRSEYEKAYLKVMKNWAAFQILLDKGVKGVAINLAEKIYKNALKFDMLEICFLISKDLKFQYGIFLGNNYKYEKFSNEFDRINKLLINKSIVENIYIKLARIYINTKNYKYDSETKALEEELIDIEQKFSENESYFSYYYLYESWYLLNIFKKDNKKLLKISETAIDYFSKFEGYNNLALFSFTEKKGVAFLTLKKFDEALISFNNCLAFIPTKGGISWHYMQNYIFITYILLRKYRDALNLIHEVILNKSFLKLSDGIREPWYLKEAFIHFLIKIGKIIPTKEEEEKLRVFRLSRFMNEVSKFSKDKRGLNITINIIQMLFLIVDEKYDDVLDKLTALKQYNFRYLKRPEYYRSSNFIKMLLKIPEGNYRASEIRIKAQKHYDELLNNPSDFSEHNLSLEIIPYEQLWEDLLSIFPE